jgi:hypothetical protein
MGICSSQVGAHRRSQPAEVLAVQAPARAPQRLEHGPVGLAGAEVLDACPPHYAGPLVGRPAMEEGLEHRRLADAGLAGDKDHLPLPGQRLLG